VVVVALGVCALWWFRPAARGDAFVVQLVGDHVLNALGHEKPLEVTSSDATVVENWFAGRLDFAVKLPRLAGATLVGGRLCSVAGRRVALVFYDHLGHRLSLFVMDAARERGPHACDQDVKGFTVCRQTVHGVEYAVVADLPPGEVEPLLKAGL
jgi:anti-sigma factor RsiW